MARIELVITAESAEEFRNTLMELNGIGRWELGVTVVDQDEDPSEQPVATATQDAEASPPKRRGRPRKDAQPAEPDNGTSASATPVSGGSAEAISGPPAQGEPSPGGVVDPFAAAPSPPTSVASPASPAPDINDVRAAAMAYGSANSLVALQKLLMENFQAADGTPVKQIGTLKVEDYQSAILLLSV